MEENIFSECQINEKIKLIMGQTNYDKEQATIKLHEFNYNEINVIRDYLGIKEKKPTNKSINQEIYKQIRKHLDKSMREYNERVKNSQVNTQKYTPSHI